MSKQSKNVWEKKEPTSAWEVAKELIDIFESENGKIIEGVLDTLLINGVAPKKLDAIILELRKRLKKNA